MKLEARCAVALALFACAGCGKTPTQAAPPVASAAATSPVAEPSPGETDYTIATSASDCVAGGACSVTLKLAATSGYHINDQYPYKYIATEAPSVEFHGTDAQGKNVFSKAAGDFTTQGATVGVMTVKFSPKSKGDVTIDGTFKLSVCSEANCKIDSATPKVTVAVK